MGRRQHSTTPHDRRRSKSETCITLCTTSTITIFATMGPSLRSRISKRTTESPQREVNSATSSSPSLLSALDHSQRPAVPSKENLSTPPPPAPKLMLPTKPEKLRCSPSRSLLHRYKGRAPGKNEAAMPAHSDDRMTAPDLSKVTTRSRGKTAAFTENFQHSKSAIELTTPPKAFTTSLGKSTIRTVGGVDFEMMNASQPLRSRSAEPPRGRSIEENDNEKNSFEFRRRRGTRSQSRKEERSDSTVGGIDDDTTKARPTTTTEPPASKTTPPRGRLTLKKKTYSDPPVVLKARIPRVTRSTAGNPAKNGPLTSNPTHPVDSSSDDSESDDSDCNFILDSPIGRLGISTEKSDQPIQPTRVFPPIHYGSILPGLIWASPLSGTSRPESPWLWCKRWTCCVCQASTIVEQHVCARLTCGHQRCGNQCKVARNSRGFTV